MRGYYILLVLFFLDTLLISARALDSDIVEDDQEEGQEEGPFEDRPGEFDPDQQESPQEEEEEEGPPPLPQACWISSYGRGVGKIPTCGEGLQMDAGLCYPKCPDNFKSVGPVCWANELSYGRGVGTPPNQCGPNQDKNGALCYNRCNPGYHGVGPVCWKGILSHVRGAGNIPNQCGEGREYDAGLCYPRCRGGFHGVGPVCWNDNKTIPRGVGKIPDSCPDGDKDAALCYPKCNPGYKGIGPVCWQNVCPPEFPTKCGAICVASVESCGDTLTSIAHQGINVAMDPVVGLMGSLDIVKQLYRWPKCGFASTDEYKKSS